MLDTSAPSPAAPSPVAPLSTTLPPTATGAVSEASATELYQSSQTFLLRSPDPRVILLRYITVGSVLLLFFAVIPLLTAVGVISDSRVNVLGRYLCFAIVALGIDLIWGYTGLLSLCQALFFALGGYAMAMHLSLKQGGGDVRPEYNNIPQFMFFNNLHQLPGFWKPFSSLSWSIVAALMVPAAFAAVFGFLILRKRVRGVYFSIITQALAQACWLLMCRNEMLVGGTNGLTNFNKAMNESRHWIIGLYLLTLTCLALAYLFCRALIKSRLGRVLVAIRDKETRLYFAGYKPHAFKVFAFAIGAMLAGLGGMLYPAQTGIITPQNMDVTASIFMVVGVALGGRGKLWGAVFGALLLKVLESSLSTSLPLSWLLVLGSIAVGVVLFLPDGFAGIWDRLEKQVTAGAGFWRSALTALPLLAVGLFIIAEVLGLVPRFLQGSQHSPFGVPTKYWILVLILASVGIYEYIEKKGGGRKARGFQVQLVAPATSPTGGNG